MTLIIRTDFKKASFFIFEAVHCFDLENGGKIGLDFE